MAQTPTRVQYRVGPTTQTSQGGAVQTLNIALPDPTPVAGNTLVAYCSWSSATILANTPTDDKGNTWFKGPAAQDATNGLTGQTFYSLAVLSGTQVVTFSLASSISGNSSFGCHLGEIFNAPTFDASHAATGTTSTISAGTFTETSGDYIFMGGTCDNPGVVNGAFTVGTGYQFAGESGWDFFAVEDGISSSSSVTPSFTYNCAGSVASAIALKPGASGGALSAGVRFYSIQTLNQPSAQTTPVTIPFSTVGRNWIFETVTVKNGNVTGITDSKGNTWSSILTEPFGGTGSNQVQMAFCQNCNPDPNMTVTLTMNATVTNGQLWVGFEDTTGGTNTPWDTNGPWVLNGSSALFGTPTDSGLINAATVNTLAQAHELVVCLQQEVSETVKSVSPGYFEKDYSGVYAGSDFEEDGGLLGYNAPTTASFQTSFTYADLNGAQAISEWACICGAFKAPAIANACEQGLLGVGAC